MKDIAIYGAGGFGKEVYLLIQRINQDNPQWNFIGYYDRMYEKGYDNGYGMVLGGIDDLNAVKRELALVVAMGDSNVTKEIVSKISNENIIYPNLIAPSNKFADMSKTKLGKGNIIQGLCTISCDVEIGDFNVLNGQISIGHDVKIGNYNSIMPGVFISGYVTIGDGTLEGVGSIIIPNIKIGDGTRIGAGAVLMTKPKAGGLYIGNPAKLMKY